MTDELQIIDLRFKFKETRDDDCVKLLVDAGIYNPLARISDNRTLRVWFEGKNTHNEDVQIVLQEHLYIPPKTTKTVMLSAPLYYPCINSQGYLEGYSCTAQLLNEDEEIILSSEFPKTNDKKYIKK